MTTASSDKQFWNRAARADTAWYNATGFDRIDDSFFESGVTDVRNFLGMAGVAPPSCGALLELGSGAGRMTRFLSDVCARVIAADISETMLARAQENLAGRTNVEYIALSGDGTLPFDDASVQAVVSHTTLNHVSTIEAQERYLTESLRVVKPGGWAVLQMGRTGFEAAALDLRANLGNALLGHKTLSRSWRGARLSEAAVRRHRPGLLSIDILRSDPRHVWVVARR